MFQPVAMLTVPLTVAVHRIKKPFSYAGFDNLNTDGHRWNLVAGRLTKLAAGRRTWSLPDGDGKLDLINIRLQPGDRIRANEKSFQRFVRRGREISGGG